MVEQLSVSSGSYPPGTNEFLKAGFTEERSVLVKPPRVKEAPIAFECKVNQIIELGDQGAAGNLVICEVLLIHHNDDLADENGNIIAERLDPISRLGYNNYVRFTKENIFETPKPLKAFGVGVDAIPEWVKKDNILTGNELGKLASISIIPDKEEIEITFQPLKNNINNIKVLLQQNKIREAWILLLNM
jgi:hypothetical protein